MVNVSLCGILQKNTVAAKLGVKSCETCEKLLGHGAETSSPQAEIPLLE